MLGNMAFQRLVDETLIVAAAGFIDLGFEPVDYLGIESDRDSRLARCSSHDRSTSSL